MKQRTWRVIALGLCGVLYVVPARAQERRTSDDTSRTASRLVLRVVADASRPVADAEIALSGQGRSRTVRTDSSGMARVDGLPAGLFTARVRRVGLAPVAVELRIGLGSNALTIRLEPTRAYLDEVRVIADARLSARLDEFEMRRLRGEASSTITREEIVRRNPISLSQMLRGKSGIRIADSLGSIVAVSRRGAKPSRAPRDPFGMVDCVLRVTVDGITQPALTNLDATLPQEIYGVEIYNGAARLPVQFGGLRTDNWCGLIAIYTRDR